MRRPEDVKRRLGNIQQIEDIVTAMRGLAAAHSLDAQKHLAAISAHEATVARAISQVLAYMQGSHGADASTDAGGPHLVVVIGAEQGFAGSYNENIVDAVLGGGGANEPTEFIVIGQRAIVDFDVRGLSPVWSANMISQSEHAASLASNIVDAIFGRIRQAGVVRVMLAGTQPDARRAGIEMKQLLPFDFSRFAQAASMQRPMFNVPPSQLLEDLVEEYVFTELCQAIILAFAAENDARMRAMTRARTNVDRIRQDLKLELNQSRQEQTTTEIIELSASSAGTRAR
jgi:F-type H+-transporting ATPase subunit gamma